MDETLDLREARAETFEPAIGSQFMLGDADGALVLVDVLRYAVQPHAPRPEPFSLVFRGASGIGQGVRQLEHPVLGRMAVFLVPTGPGPDGQPRYEAAFN